MHVSQEGILQVWSEDRANNKAAAQRKAEELAKVNSDASNGILFDHHPSILSDASLNESFRGWSTS